MILRFGVAAEPEDRVRLAEAPRRLRRICRDFYNDGPLRLAGDQIYRRWKRTIDRRTCVWQWIPASTSPGVALLDGLWVGRYDRPEEVPVAFYRELDREEGSAGLDRALDEFLGGGVLWVPWLFGRPEGFLWTRRNTATEPVAVTISLVLIFERYRRMGIGRRTLADVCLREVPPGGRAIAEPFVWDVAATRTLEAAGFRRATS